MTENFPAIVQQALGEPEPVRAWALANAVSMVFVDDAEADAIFAKLTGRERMLLGRCITRAALPAIKAALATSETGGAA